MSLSKYVTDEFGNIDIINQNPDGVFKTYNQAKSFFIEHSDISADENFVNPIIRCGGRKVYGIFFYCVLPGMTRIPAPDMTIVRYVTKDNDRTHKMYRFQTNQQLYSPAYTVYGQHQIPRPATHVTFVFTGMCVAKRTTARNELYQTNTSFLKAIKYMTQFKAETVDDIQFPLQHLGADDFYPHLRQVFKHTIMIAHSVEGLFDDNETATLYNTRKGTKRNVWLDKEANHVLTNWDVYASKKQALNTLKFAKHVNPLINFQNIFANYQNDHPQHSDTMLPRIEVLSQVHYMCRRNKQASSLSIKLMMP